VKTGLKFTSDEATRWRPVDDYAGADGVSDAAETQAILTKTKIGQRTSECHRQPVTNHRRYRLRLSLAQFVVINDIIGTNAPKPTTCVSK